MAGGTARAAVFGVSDGLVSNVSLILGFAGSGADASIVRLAGLAGAIAGGISMAAGEWISVSAQNELIERELEIERRELQHHPTAETEELAGMYEADGMSPEHARRAAADVMRRPDEALAVHARAELGVDPDSLASPLACGCLVAGVLPVRRPAAGAAVAVRRRRGRRRRSPSVVIGVVAAAAVGALIGRLADRSIARSIVRQVLIVLGACARHLRHRPARRHQRRSSVEPLCVSRRRSSASPMPVDVRARRAGRPRGRRRRRRRRRAP